VHDGRDDADAVGHGFLQPPDLFELPDGNFLLKTEVDRAGEDLAEAKAKESEEEAQAKFDEYARRSQRAQERARREREEANIAGRLSEAAEVFYELQLKPRVQEIHSYEQKVRVPVVQGLLFQNSLAWLAGPSGTFKSFVVADLAFRYGTGDMDYHGRRMTNGRALLIIAEGAAGYADRRVAWEREHGTEVKQVDIYPAPLQLADLEKEMPALLHLLRQADEDGRPYGLVVFDTQAMCTVGIDENSSEMNLVTNVLHRVREVSGACVLTVHHFGKTESKGMRGSSMIYAAADTVIVVDREKDTMDVTLSTGGEHGKQKDAVAEKDFLKLTMRSRQVGLDYFNDPVSSLVPVPADVVPEHVEDAEPLPEIAGLDLFWLKALGTYAGDGCTPGMLRERITSADADPDDDMHTWLRPPDGHRILPQTPSNRLQRLKDKGLAESARVNGRPGYVISVRGHQVLAREIINREQTEEAWSRRAQPRRVWRKALGEGQDTLETPSESMIEQPG
jgi:hypothetical protein